jgi:terminase large subunit-like protein
MDPFYLQPRQVEFCQSIADICVFGGSAGGGKSRALIQEPVCRDLHSNPGFTGVIFRRHFTEITEAGGLWDEASDVYPYLDAAGMVGAHEFRFPSGAKIGFRHLEHEETKYNYKGSQMCYLAFDEVTSFSEAQFWYLTSRNRSMCGITPYVRASCNPDPGWVKTALLAPWVDREYQGRPAQSGEIRWIKRNAEGLIEWHEQAVPRSKTLTFIRSKLTDNPALLAKNPEYLLTLEMLPTVERERLLNGNWDIRREGAVYPDFETIIEQSGPDRPPTNGGLDFGWNNPFAAVYGHQDSDGVLWITGCRYKSFVTLPGHSEALPKDVEWWADPSGAGLIAELRNAGHQVRPCVHMPTRGSSGEKKSPLLSGIDAVNVRIRSRRLRIVRCPETMPIIREFGSYHYDEDKRLEEPVKEDDHTMDALRYLIVGLDRGRTVPPLKPPETAPVRAAREAAEARIEYDRRKAADDNREADLWSDKYWGAT